MDETPRPAVEQRHSDEMAREHIARRVSEGASREAIVQELIQRGYDPGGARDMVGSVGRKRRLSARTLGLVYLVAGIVVAALAIGVTVSSYDTAAAQGGPYVICWGAALGGLYLTARGIWQLVSGRKPK